MSFGVVLPLFRVAFPVMVLQLVELDVDPPCQIGVGSGIGIVETLLHQGIDVVEVTNSHRMTNCMNPVSDAFMVNVVQYQAVAEYLPSGEACPSIWWNHAIIAFCDVPFQIALSIGLLGCPPRVLRQGCGPGGSLLVRSLFCVRSVHAVAVFSSTSLALTAFWDSRCTAPAALSCLFFLRPPSRASQSFPLFALWKFELGGGVGQLLASVLCLDVDFGFALLFADGNHQGGFEYALFTIARWGDHRPNGLK